MRGRAGGPRAQRPLYAWDVRVGRGSSLSGPLPDRAGWPDDGLGRSVGPRGARAAPDPVCADKAVRRGRCAPGGRERALRSRPEHVIAIGNQDNDVPCSRGPDQDCVEAKDCEALDLEGPSSAGDGAERETQTAEASSSLRTTPSTYPQSG